MSNFPANTLGALVSLHCFSFSYTEWHIPDGGFSISLHAKIKENKVEVWTTHTTHEFN